MIDHFFPVHIRQASGSFYCSTTYVLLRLQSSSLAPLFSLAVVRAHLVGTGFSCIHQSPVTAQFAGHQPPYYEPRELELERIQTQMTQKPMLRAEVGMRVRCANKASAE